MRLWRKVADAALAALQNLGKYVSELSGEIELNLSSFVEAVAIVSGLGPELTLLFALDRGLAETVFNVGTCLVVMFSVRRRNVWLLLAAVLWNVSYSELSRIVAFSVPVLERGHSYFESLLIIFSPSLTKFLVALLPFLLFFGLRRIKGVRYGAKGDDELEELMCVQIENLLLCVLRNACFVSRKCRLD